MCWGGSGAHGWVPGPTCPLHRGCSPSVHPQIPSREAAQSRGSPCIPQTGMHRTPAARCAAIFGARPPVPVPGVFAVQVHSEAPAVAVAAGLAGAGALGTREPLGWRAGTVLQCEGLAADRAPICSRETPDISPAAPSPGSNTCPGRLGCPLGWARRVPPVDASPSKPQPTGTPTLCP